MKNKYRIVKDNYSGYQADVKRWWYPFWMQIGTNTRRTVEESEELIKMHQKGLPGKFVKFVE